MRPIWKLSTVILGILFYTSGALGQDGTILDSFDALPDCSIEIFRGSFESSICGAVDRDCFCGDKNLRDSIALEVSYSCSIKDTLFFINVISQGCNDPIRNRGGFYTNLSTTLVVIAAAFTIHRFAFKIWSHLRIEADDWATLVTFIFCIPCAAINTYGAVPSGFGRDVWTLESRHVDSFGRYFYILTVIYFLQVSLLKLAMLFFYLRIFPGQTTRRLLWATAAINCVFGAVTVLMSIFACQPITYNWMRWDGEHEGTCMDVDLIFWANASISIALDVWMMAVPLWKIRSLQLDWKKKVGTGIMFFLGTFITFISIIRLRTLIIFSGSTFNLTWDYIETAIWSVIEIDIGIVCLCLPTFRLFLVRISPRLFGTSLSEDSSRMKRGYHGRKGDGSGVRSHGSSTAKYTNLSSSRDHPGGEDDPMVAKPWPVAASLGGFSSASAWRGQETEDVAISGRDEHEGSGESREMIPLRRMPTVDRGILYQKSFSISYQEDTDEQRLVRPSGSKS